MSKMISDLVNKVKKSKEVNTKAEGMGQSVNPHPIPLPKEGEEKENVKAVTVFGFEFSIINEFRQIVETKMFGAISEDEAEAISIARNDAEKDLLPGYSVEYTGKFIKQQTVIRKVDESLLNNTDLLGNMPGRETDTPPAPSQEGIYKAQE